MTLRIESGQVSTYYSNEIDLIESFSTNKKGGPDKAGAPYRKAVEFSVIGEKPQNIFIGLEGSNEDLDLDIYLAPKEFTQIQEDSLIIEQSIESSTKHGNTPEQLFARLEPGDYYVEIRVNKNSLQSRSISDKDAHFYLTLDSKAFDLSISHLPNDPLLSQQWHLFNGGLLSLRENPEFPLEKDIQEYYEGILPNTDIFAPEAWKISTSAKDIVVAVVDNGVDIDHPDLKNNIWVNQKELEGKKKSDDDNNGYKNDIHGWNFGNDTPNPSPHEPSNSHGTHVAGLIGAEGNNGIGVTGVAWDVQLMALNVENRYTGNFFLSDIDKALEYAADNGADIVNMSFNVSIKVNPADLILYTQSNGSSTDDAPSNYTQLLDDYQSVFTQLEDADALIVISAGNDNKINTIKSEKWDQSGDLDNSLNIYNFMASFFDNAMNISASDGMGNLSPYSNTGLMIDLAAPGGNRTGGTALGILSTYPLGGAQDSEEGFIIPGTDGNVDYGYMQGTSMAAPIVSGAAALVKATNPSLSAADIRDILMFSAHRNPNLESLAGENGLQLDLHQALLEAEKWKSPRDLFDFLNGTKQDDVLRSGSESAWYRGRKGDDVITGNHGDDRLYGNKGDDIITPGKGFDIVKGGKGKDTITYNHPEESPIARPDRVFMKASDRIDLSAIDGDSGEYSEPGNQSLQLIETSTFNGIPGELLARRNGVFADLDGDAYADFGILFGKPLSFDLSSDHFIL